MISDCEAKLLEPGQRLATVMDGTWKYGVIELIPVGDWRKGIFKIWVIWDVAKFRYPVALFTSNAYIQTVCQNCGRVRDEHVLQLPNYKCLFGSTMYRGLYQPKEPRDGEANSP
jgi:hypothetical protein